MTYAVSAPLQAAVYQTLAADVALSVLVGTNIFDAPPAGPLPATYVSLGPETVTEAGDSTSNGAVHDFVVSVVTEVAGFQTAKEAAGAVSDALHGATLTLSRGCVAGLWFRKAKAARQNDGVRRIDLTFRASVEDTQPL
ncbi:DUF3168 domain-containing protein [Tropicibacter naphthalenivorans]|uniref:Gene transfer agent protein n=1 Tax=Tropicibacter naphthalenivorans TaxID=441103 RepID=A0A0P1GVE7_9RHOB|nr:DUF3168 domain-containing protein [Tropicibacter naphthalenivorans]CUH80187.1 hypothetical protein TRN7648_02862 [Tropicibacter naphthalenivorans]SMC85463.1 Protein of unknown function [Tropicibacter naphthalenivorans]